MITCGNIDGTWNTVAPYSVEFQKECAQCYAVY